MARTENAMHRVTGYINVVSCSICIEHFRSKVPDLERFVENDSAKLPRMMKLSSFELARHLSHADAISLVWLLGLAGWAGCLLS